MSRENVLPFKHQSAGSSQLFLDDSAWLVLLKEKNHLEDNFSTVENDIPSIEDSKIILDQPLQHDNLPNPVTHGLPSPVS